MPKKLKKAASKPAAKSKGQSKFTKKYFIVFGILLAALYLALFQIQTKQTYQQHAQSQTCGSPGDMGNEQGIGKYCTQGGGQCQGLQASICSADIQLNGSGICSKSCNTNADCGTGAVCYQDTLGKGCEPVACEATPTPATPAPTNVCLGAGCPTPTISQTPGTSTQPTQQPVPTTIPTTGGGGNLLQLFLQFIMLIISFFTSLFGGK